MAFLRSASSCRIRVDRNRRGVFRWSGSRVTQTVHEHPPEAHDRRPPRRNGPPTNRDRWKTLNRNRLEVTATPAACWVAIAYGETAGVFGIGTVNPGTAGLGLTASAAIEQEPFWHWAAY